MHIGLAIFCFAFLGCLFSSSGANLLDSQRRLIGHVTEKSSTKSQLPLRKLKLISIMHQRGGSAVSSIPESVMSDSNDKEKYSIRKIVLKNAVGIWAVAQVLSILANAIKRLYPIALQPFLQKDLLPYQWALYVAWSLYMAYAEGYKAFQLKFSPMVVQRAFSICDNPNIFNCVLAGPYSMGLFGASRKRMIVSWCITAGVFSLVKIVKMLPYPYRSIVDAGVVVGLSYGTLSIVILAVKALLGGKVVAPDEDTTNSTDKSSSATTTATKME